jgi:hypothetical protein
MKTLAQKLIINPSGSPVEFSGPLKINGLTDFKLTDIIGLVITYLFPLAGVILFFIIIWGGIDLLMSQGEPEKITAGQGKITSGIIGMVLLVLSYLFARIIGYVFGVGGGLF